MNVPQPLRFRFQTLPTALCLCVLSGIFVPPVQAETIYTYTNSQGDRVFTDEPTKGARKIHVDPPPPIPLTPINLPPVVPPPAAYPAGNELPQSQSPASTSAPNAPLVPSVQMRPPESAARGISVSPAPAAVTAPQEVPAAPKPVSPIGQGHYQSLVITEPRPGPVKAHPGGTIFVQVKLDPALDVAVGDRIRIVIDGEDKVEDSTGHRFMISGLSDGEHTLIALVARQGKNIFQSRPVVIHLTGASG